MRWTSDYGRRGSVREERTTVETTTLKERVEVTLGRQRSPQHAVGDHVIPYLRAANVKNGELALDSVLEMNFSPSEQGKFRLLPGDVLVTEGCGSLGQIGAAAQWNNEIAGPVGFQNTLLRLRAIDGLSDPGFVYQWARWAFESGAFAAEATGTSIFHIGAKRAAVMRFPDIPVEKQRRIADLLGHVDQVVEEARREAAASQRLLEARREALLAKAEDRSGWNVYQLADVVDLKLGFTKGRKLTGKTIDIPYLRAANVRDGELRLDDIKEETVTVAESSKWLLAPDDILMIEGGNPEDLGRGWIWEGQITPYIHQNSVFRGRVTRDDVIPRFVAYAITCREARSYCMTSAIQTSNIAHIGTSRMSKLPIPIPPIEEQESIISELDRLRSVREAMTEKIAAASNLRRALIGVLVVGAYELPASYDRFLSQNGVAPELLEPVAI